MKETDELYGRMAQYDEQFKSMAGRDVKYCEIRKMVNAIVKPFGASVSLINEINKTKKKIPMSGYYDFKKPKRHSIKLFMHKQFKQNSIVMTPDMIEEFRHRLVQVLHHELQHRHQAEKRKKSKSTDHFARLEFVPGRRITKKQLSDIRYLTDHDEIDAYAHDIAYEIKHKYPGHTPTKILRNATSRRYLGSLKFYTEGFKGLDWSDVREDLLSRVYKWLPKVKLLHSLDFCTEAV